MPLVPDDQDWIGKRVTIMGLGTFGGGVGAARFLSDRGASVLVTDLRTEDELSESLATLEHHSPGACEFRLGEHCEDDFRSCDVLVATPAVPRSNHYIQVARTSGAIVTSEMNLFWHYNRGRIIGVTGSNGKSTTTAMIHAILDATGTRCWLGGNIGSSLLPHALDIEPDDWVILELSSFQLADLDETRSSPDIAVVTGFSPNHLDWHGTLDEYRSAKQTILRWQTTSQTAVLNADDSDVKNWPTNGVRMHVGNHAAETLGVGQTDTQTVVRTADTQTEIPLNDWLKLPGPHNMQNARIALCATVAAGLPPSSAKAGLEQFRGLPHRLEFVGEVNGREFYNDSLATTPESVEVALAAFDKPIILLAGGYDKKVDLSGLAESICKKTKAVALMGQTAPFLASQIEALRTEHHPAYQQTRSFPESLHWAVRQSEPGDIVLLSPGCASYDWFRNFQERGEQFREFVDQINS